MNHQDQLIEKLFKGECSQQELETLFDWLKENTKKDHSEIMEKLWNEMARFPELDPNLSSSLIQNTLEKINQNEELLPNRENSESKVKRFYPIQSFRKWALVAASILLIGLIPSIWYWQIGMHLETIQTSFGEWKEITLADGSNISVNPNSEVKYYTNWYEKDSREIWVKGEVFFEVAKDPEGKSFNVHADGIHIEVLGTSFNVYNRKKQTEIFLEEGKLKLNIGTDNKFLEPGDFLAYSGVEKEIVAHKKNYSDSFESWKEGSLFLKDHSVREILEKIEEIYGYEVIIQNEIRLTQLKTVAIPKNKIEIAIPILERVLERTIQVEKDYLIIK